MAYRFQSLADITNRLKAIMDSAAAPPAEAPEIAAARYSEQLRQSNRKVQLGELKKAIDPVFQGVRQYVANLRGTLGLFRVEIVTAVSMEPSLPEGVDDVGSRLWASIQPEHCSDGRIIVYSIGAVGREAILLRAEIQTSGAGMGGFAGGMGMFGGGRGFSQPAKQDVAKWTEVARYSGEDPLAMDIIIEDFKRTLNQLMGQLAAGENGDKSNLG
jgi:hypothetical protein